MQLNPVLSWSVAICLAAIHWILAVLASKHNACTFDEVAHIAGGLGHVIHSDYRLNPENGVLPQIVAGLSMAAGGVQFPDVSDLSRLEAHSWRHSDSWEIGYQTLYGVGNDASTVLLLGRAAVALSGAGTVLAVHGLARYVHDGELVGSLLPTLLATLCPTMLAHGALVTSDGVFTLFATLAPASICWMLNAAAEDSDWLPKWRRCVVVSVLAGSCVGGIFTAKHSGVVIAPIAVFLLLLRMWKVPIRRLPSFLLFAIPSILISVASMLAVVWGLYGMRYGAFKHEECIQWKSNWEAGLGSQHGRLEGVPAQLVALAREHRLLPEAMLYGMSYAFLSTHARACFLAGKHGTAGWRYFFPYAVAVKTPTGVFVLAALALLALCCVAAPRDRERKGADAAPSSPGKLKSCMLRQRLGPMYRMAPLASFFVLYWAVAINQNLNIGHRHMLPIYPAVYVFCGFCGRFFAAQAPPAGSGASNSVGVRGVSLLMQTLVLVGACLLASEVLGAFPYFLPFFNSLAGGPELGYTHLVDSSLDWGQALPALKLFVDGEAAAVRAAGSTDPLYFYMSYFGLGNPPYHNLSTTEDYVVMHLHSSVSGVSRPKHLQEVNVALQPGYFCIGASMLQPVYNNHAPGNWNAHYETMYRRQARFMLRLMTVPDPLQHHIVTGQVPELHDMPRMLNWMDGFRLGRLSAFFREGPPYAQPGFGFNVYKVDQPTLKRFLYGPSPKETARNDMTFLRLSLR